MYLIVRFIAEAERKWQDILTDRKKRKCTNSVTAYCDRMARAYSNNPPLLPQQSLKKRLLENKSKTSVSSQSLPRVISIEKCFPPLPLPGENGVKQLKPASHLAQSTDKSAQLIKQLAQPSSNKHLIQSPNPLAKSSTNQLGTSKYSQQPSSTSILSAQNKPAHSAGKSTLIHSSAGKHSQLINVPPSPVNQLSQLTFAELASKPTLSASISNQLGRKSTQSASIFSKTPASKAVQPASKPFLQSSSKPSQPASKSIVQPASKFVDNFVDNSENDEVVEKVREKKEPRWSGMEDVMLAYSRYWKGTCVSV